MFAATPMIGGVALLAFFVAAWRLLRNPFVALARARVLRVPAPRGVVLARLATRRSRCRCWCSPRSGSSPTAARSSGRGSRSSPGSSSGMLQAARIDGLVSLMGVGAAVRGHVAASAAQRDRRRVARERGRVRARADPRARARLHRRDGAEHQYILDLHENVRSLGALMVASIVFALLLVVIVPPIARRVHRVPERGRMDRGRVRGRGRVRPRGSCGRACSTCTAIVERPDARLAAGRGRRGRSHGATTPSARCVWMSWYLGPIARRGRDHRRRAARARAVPRPHGVHARRRSRCSGPRAPCTCGSRTSRPTRSG